MKKILYYLGLGMAGLIILAAIALYSIPLFTPYLQKHREDIEHLVSGLLHYQVRVGDIQAERNGINPEFQLHKVFIYDQSGKHLIGKFDNLYIRVSLIDSLFNWRLTSNFLLLSGAQLDLYKNKAFNLFKHRINLLTC